MNRSFDKQIEELKSRIDEAQYSSRQGSNPDLTTLIKDNLLAADKALLKARQHNQDKHHNNFSYYFRLAELRLALAKRYMEPNSKPSNQHMKPQKVGTIQELINQLDTRLIDFKTIVEWKNYSLPPSLERCYIDCIKLREDALAELLAGRQTAAKKSAQAGLILLEYISLASADDRIGQTLTAKNYSQVQLPKDAEPIRSSINKFRAVRRLLGLSKLLFEQRIPMGLSKAAENAEDALVDSIWAYARDDKASLEKAMLGNHFRIGSLEHNLLQAIHSLENDEADEIVSLPPKIMGEFLAMSKDGFERQACTFFHAVKERVLDKQALGDLTVSIWQNYKDMHDYYLTLESMADSAGLIKIYAEIGKADLKKLRLLLSQAKIN